ncbi:hypothetical protein HanLR1_Chr17g0666291 [Helianthus annuus]|nr:hypothetical protein HanHA89_Chr17g0707641 [Helianthus annuus]KAJ0632546.1 hypothetical protein HanLR1_Chr17g0666291 [Helianthus annuus]
MWEITWNWCSADGMLIVDIVMFASFVANIIKLVKISIKICTIIGMFRAFEESHEGCD